MKKMILMAVVAVLLASCGNDKKPAEKDWTKNYTPVFADTVERGDQQEEKPAPQDEKSSTSHSSSTRVSKHQSKEPDNMRGFDPASEDDMDDNGMSRYFDNNDDEGWD